MDQSDRNLLQHAHLLAQQTIITDGHVDLPYRLQVRNFRLEREYLGIPVQTDDGDFDYERAREGGLDAPFMSIFIPSAKQEEEDGGRDMADDLIDMVEGIIAAHPDKFGYGRTPLEIEQNTAEGLISLPMGLENGAPLLDLEDIGYFYDRGIRYVTLTHGKDNHICDSSYDTTRTWGGLSPFGREVVAEMNRIGMMVDVSHISDEAFFEVMALSAAPVIASHSSCRVFTPGWERNMSDDMIRLMGERNGVIQINFGSDFLDAEVSRARKNYEKDLNDYLRKKKIDDDDPRVDEARARFRAKYPALYSDVSRVADHIDHVREIAGIDHIGLGSDFDGVGDSLPMGLKDVSMYPNLIHELLRRGYSDEDIEKICYRNVWRVWNDVNRVAGR
jgi:membrane dipeptidase